MKMSKEEGVSWGKILIIAGLALLSAVLILQNSKRIGLPELKTIVFSGEEEEVEEEEVEEGGIESFKDCVEAGYEVSETIPAQCSVPGGETFTQPVSNIEPNFSKTGVLMKDNPGLVPGVWYLSYEAPGQPGLKIQLDFHAKSTCSVEGSDQDCSQLDENLVGERATVGGVEAGNKVWVHTLRVGE